jgi:hypothetical protein
MRNNPNQAIYDVAGLITETEARNVPKKAEGFVEMIWKELRRVT